MSNKYVCISGFVFEKDIAEVLHMYNCHPVNHSVVPALNGNGYYVSLYSNMGKEKQARLREIIVNIIFEQIIYE